MNKCFLSSTLIYMIICIYVCTLYITRQYLDNIHKYIYIYLGMMATFYIDGIYLSLSSERILIP